jgi:2-keto-4-pentenoate hydratase
MTPGESDERIARGMATQLEARSRRQQAGERHLGWKVGFGTPQAMDRLGTSAPLVGPLAQHARLEPGATVSLAGWATPTLEPEIAVHLGADVAAGADRATLAEAVAGLGAAIELVDLDPDADDPEHILGCGIFQRHVMLGAVNDARSADGVTLQVRVNGEEAAAVADDVTAATGDLLDVIAGVATTLEAAGERLRAGDVVIAGSIVPALAVGPGDEVEVRLEPLGRLSVRFSD